MSFFFFRGEVIFPNSQIGKVPPPYLRNYAKTTNRHLNECIEHPQPLSGELDGTIQGRSLGRTENLPSFNKLGTLKPSEDPSNAAKSKHVGPPMNLEKTVSETDRSQLLELNCAIQSRVSATNLEPINSGHPLSGMKCKGQRMSLAEAQQNASKKGGISAAPEERKDSLGRDNVLSNGTTIANSQGVSLNKLYSCLKKLKCRRRTEAEQYKDLATISMNGRERGLSRKYFRRVLDVNNGCNARPRRDEHEEVFLLFGGKSKPVRFQINPDGLNLLEKEWHIELKSRDSMFCNSDDEGLQLLRKFRDHFRGKQRIVMDRRQQIPQLPIPWARHVVHKGRNIEPQEKDQLDENESGRKLSIHVYLPNASWEEQRHSTPVNEIY